MMNTKQKILISIAGITLVWLTTISAFAWNVWSGGTMQTSDRTKQTVQWSWSQAKQSMRWNWMMKMHGWNKEMRWSWSEMKQYWKSKEWMWMKLWELQYLRTDLTTEQKDAVKKILDTHRESVISQITNTWKTLDGLKAFLISDLNTLKSDLLQYVSTDKVDAYNQSFVDKIAKINSATSLEMLSFDKKWKWLKKWMNKDMLPPFIKSDLTDSQKAEVKAILEKHHEEMKAIHEWTGSDNVKQLSHEAVMAKLKSDLASYINPNFDFSKMPEMPNKKMR